MSDFAHHILLHESSPRPNRTAAWSGLPPHKLRRALCVPVVLFAVTVCGAQAAPSGTGAPPKTASEPVQTVTPGAPAVAIVPATPSPTEDLELSGARKRNEKAQAEYYEQLTAKLARQSEGGLTNYLGLAVAVASLSGALIAARVAYLSFFYNYQNQLRTNSDTRFFEALKRFGDKDSAAARASAAGMLVVMGKLELPKTGKRRPAFFGKQLNADALEQPYHNIALDQLLAGHMLEDNPIVLASIKAAVLELCPHDRKATAQKLVAANLKAQGDLAMALALFFSARGVRRADAIGEDLWSGAAALTDFSSAVLKELITRFDKSPTTSSTAGKIKAPPQRFHHILEQALAKLDSTGADDVPTLYDNVVADLRTAAERLRTNDELLKRILSDGAARPVLPPQVLLLEDPQELEVAPDNTK
jgi:hypothetical protein